MTPLVSVLVPSYNHAAYVGAAVRSALESIDVAGVEGEVRVLDDGSADDSLDRLRAIDDPRLHVDAQDNAGAHVAFNRLIAAARGDVIFLLNSDDLYAPRRVARLLERLRRGDALAAGSWLEVIDGDGHALGIKKAWRTLPPWPAPRRGPALAELGDPRLALLETNYLATTSNIAFRRQAIDGPNPLAFADLRYCHDWDFFLGLAVRGPLALVDEPLVRYRVHPSNTLRETEGDGTARLRFEIHWLLARHARHVLERAERGDNSDGHDPDDLRRRLRRGLPHFGAERVLLQLLALRDAGDGPFCALLDPHHPFRRTAESLLGAGR